MNNKIKLKKILATQRFGILATNSSGEPYQNIVAFAGSPDLKSIIFATLRHTNKYKNLTEDRRVSIFVDDRSNSEKDIGEATGICAVGEASEVKTGKRKSAIKTYLAKHPAMEEFANSPSTSMFSIRVKRYLIVSRFQNVLEIKP